MREIHKSYTFTIEDFDMQLRDSNIFLTHEELGEVWEYAFGYIEENVAEMDFNFLDDDVCSAYRQAITYLGEKGLIPENSDEY